MSIDYCQQDPFRQDPKTSPVFRQALYDIFGLNEQETRNDNYSVFHVYDFSEFPYAFLLLNSSQLTSLQLQGLIVLYFLKFSKFQFCKAYVAFFWCLYVQLLKRNFGISNSLR